MLVASPAQADVTAAIVAGGRGLEKQACGSFRPVLILGQRYIVWPYVEPQLRTLETYKRVAGLLNGIGSRLTKSGLHVACHNGGGEFIPQTGQLPYDVLLGETDPALVKLQIDLYWHAHDTDDPPHALFE